MNIVFWAMMVGCVVCLLKQDIHGAQFFLLLAILVAVGKLK